MIFNEAETAACQRLVELGLEEDLGPWGDITSRTFIPAELTGRVAFTARAAGVQAGLPAATLVLKAVDPALTLQPLMEDGFQLEPGDHLAIVSGSMRSILAAERTALNFLQHLSGIATQTRRYVDAVAGFGCEILDTRKTLPGWRLLEKYAVRCGGGHNHRIGLFDAILIKDNHMVSLFSQRMPGLGEIFREARQRGSLTSRFLEIEVDSLEQLDVALRAEPDIVLLDNMTLDQMREAVVRRNTLAARVLLEASGGIALAKVRAIAETGVDRISVGALTHSAPALDIALDYLE